MGGTRTVQVILAGYPEQMRQLMLTNPGLKSRFQHSVPFPDYTGKELFQIALQMLESKQLVLSPDAAERLEDICELQAELNDPMSGNARFVRNLLDVAGMRQAERLLAMESRTREALVTIERDDLEAREEDFKKSGIVLNKTIFTSTAEPPRKHKLKPPPGQAPRQGQRGEVEAGPGESEDVLQLLGLPPKREDDSDSAWGDDPSGDDADENDDDDDADDDLGTTRTDTINSDDVSDPWPPAR